MKGLIICGFPGTGKTTAAQRSKDVVDLESSGFQWDFSQDPPARREDWPRNYIQAIKEATEHFSYVLASTHEDVRLELKAADLPYVIVLPNLDLKNEYLIRYVIRGDNAEFIKRVYDNWEPWLFGLGLEGAPVIKLDSGQTISDILPMIPPQRK